MKRDRTQIDFALFFFGLTLFFVLTFAGGLPVLKCLAFAYFVLFSLFLCTQIRAAVEELTTLNSNMHCYLELQDEKDREKEREAARKKQADQERVDEIAARVAARMVERMDGVGKA